MKRPSRESGDGARVGDHEEREDQERAALHLVNRDGERIAQPPGARRTAAPRECRERRSRCRTRRAACSTRIAKKARSAANHTVEPHAPGEIQHAARGEQQHDDGEARRIPDVLAVDAEDEFRADGDHAGQRMQPGIVRPQQQAQRQSGDQRRARVECRQLEPPRADGLRCERADDGERAVERARAEIEPAEIVDQQGCERGDLVMARIGPETGRGALRHRHASGARPIFVNARSKRRKEGRAWPRLRRHGGIIAAIRRCGEGRAVLLPFFFYGLRGDERSFMQAFRQLPT